LEKNNFIIRNLLYCLPAFAFAIPTFPVMILLPALYSEKYNIDIASIGIILFTARFLDVVSDPLLGWINDKNLFRRKNLIIFGSLICGFSLHQLFSPTIVPDKIHLFIWISLLYLGWTIFQIPYLSLGYDLEKDYRGRTKISASREFFILLGLMTSVSLPLFFNKEIISTESLLVKLALFSGFFGLLFFYIFINEPRRKKYSEVLKVQKLSSELRKNLYFMKILIAWFFNSLANIFPMILFVFFITYFLGGTESDQEIILFYYFISAIFGMPFWVFLSKFFEKNRVWYFSLISSAIFFSSVFFLQNGDIQYFIIISCLTGFCLGGDLAIPPSILSDITDYHRLKFKSDISGILFSSLTFLNKIAFAFASLFVFLSLGLLDFDSKVAISIKIKYFLLISYAGIPILLKFFSAYIIKNFSLGEKMHGEITKKLYN
tara:strand:+ start:486 stop:1784 length:1299 start_codon:yes stop_codon:yes gene_type:complete